MDDLELWPFRPNWSTAVVEAIEFKTGVMTSTTGAEQRRSARPLPRREYDYTLFVNACDRAWCDNMLRANGARMFWLPRWEEAINIAPSLVSGVTTLPIPSANKRRYKVGEAVAFVDTTSCQLHAVKEVTDVTENTVSFDSEVTVAFKGSVKVAPAIKAYLDPTSAQGVQFATLTDSASTSSVKLYHGDDGLPDETASGNGPLIYDGLIVNAWARSLGRGGYFHPDSGTSEGQFIFLRAALHASTMLTKGTPDQVRAGQWFKQLTLQMAAALGDGNPNGPMLRQTVPDSADTLCELHWLFAARGDIPERAIVYAYEATSVNGKLRIPQSARGGNVYKAYMIYPASSKLLYDGTTAPAYDITTPAAQTQTTLTESDWAVTGLSTAITIPATNDVGASNSGITSWKIVYGYDGANTIPITYGYEAFPSWTLIAPYYAACAPDTFRWFDLAAEELAIFDTANSDKWNKLRAAMRRTCVIGQNIDDLRTILEPMAGFDAIPVTGDPTGMYCYSNHPSATTPAVAGANPAWLGYAFWSRDSSGNILGTIPEVAVSENSAESVASELATTYCKVNPKLDWDEVYKELLADYISAGLISDNALYQSQIGRGFSDQWRQAAAYQDADWYMYVEVSADRALTSSEHILFYMSATPNYDPTTRWFAVLDAQSGWETKTDGSLCKLYIPISEFRTRADESVGSTTWGATLQAGQTFENYGLSVEVAGSINVKLGKVRPVGGSSKEWVDANLAEATKGAKMPFFGGSLPFAINLNAKYQKFVGWNGSPFHGYQQPDLWLTCEDDAKIAHADLDPSRDLPVPDSTGGLVFPISATDADGSTRTQASMLCEQQCYFLQKAQEQYHADGGALGPFAHTFVLNTPARSSLGWPTPHTWVYVNDDPNTRWIGYQVRPVESLARLAMLTSGKAGWQTVHQQALGICLNWLNWFNGAWSSADQTIFTDYPDPRQSAPQANYDEPHGAALILRACLWLKQINAFPEADALIARLWAYLERIWAYNVGTNMEGTWSDNPSTEDWYGFWHGEVILTLTTMVEHQELLPDASRSNMVTLCYERLMATYTWLRNKGVKSSNQSEIEGFDTYNGYAIFPFKPNVTGEGRRTYSRKYISFDNSVSPVTWIDSAGRQFEQWSETFDLHGRDEINLFEKLFTSVEGQRVPFWYPTHLSDFELYAPITAGDMSIRVKPCGYTDYIFSQGTFLNIILYYRGGSYDVARITACDKSSLWETLALDTAFTSDKSMGDVTKISYINLARFSADRLELNYLTDKDGTATVTTVLQSAPEIRSAPAALYQ